MRPILTTIVASIALAASNSAFADRWTMQDVLSVNGINQAQLSPDGQSVAFVRGGQVMIMPAAGGEGHALSRSAGGREGLAWSPDGKKIAYAKAGNICVLSLPPGPGELSYQIRNAGCASVGRSHAAMGAWRQFHPFRTGWNQTVRPGDDRSGERRRRGICREVGH